MCASLSSNILGTKVATFAGDLLFLLADVHANDEILAEEVGYTALTPGRAAYLDVIPPDPGVDSFVLGAPGTTGSCCDDFLVLQIHSTFTHSKRKE